MNEREFFEGRLAWITGGSSGIGAELARRLASAGARVIVSSFDIPGLESHANRNGQGV